MPDGKFSDTVNNSLPLAGADKGSNDSNKDCMNALIDFNSELISVTLVATGSSIAIANGNIFNLQADSNFRFDGHRHVVKSSGGAYVSEGYVRIYSIRRECDRNRTDKIMKWHVNVV